MLWRGAASADLHSGVGVVSQWTHWTDPNTYEFGPQIQQIACGGGHGAG